MKTLYLCGAGNSEGVRLALVINADESRWDRIVLLDDDPATHGRVILGVEIAGPFSMLAEADPDLVGIVNLVARTTHKRWLVRSRLESFGLPFIPLVHPSVDTRGVKLGNDVIVYQNATLGPGASVGDGSVVFMGAVVGHETRTGECCVIAANAVLNARVELGDRVYIGANATVLPELRIGSDATVGIGSAVIQDVLARTTVMGVPAQVIWPPEGVLGARFSETQEIEEEITAS